MAAFLKIEIHFRDPVAGERRAVIRPRGPVQAIFLHGREALFLNLKGSGKPPREVGRRVTKRPPDGVTLEGQIPPPKGTARGPGEVCYLVNGVLECWDPDE